MAAAVAKRTAVHRLGRALVHLLQAVCLAPVIALVLLPVWLGLLGPWTSLGLCSSDDQVGLPQSWVAWRKLPYIGLTAVLVDLPVALLHAVYVAVGIPLHAVILAGLELHHALAAHLCSSCARPPPLAHEPAAFTPVDLENRARREESVLHSHSSDSARTSLALAHDGRYRLHASIWAALEGGGGVVQRGDVRLISLVWLMGLAKRGGVLQRRQELPMEAFIDSE
eukprot:856432-Prymnesium_polylepis.2